MNLQYPSIYPIALSYGECISCNVRLKFNSLRIIVNYRPPKADFSIFFDEFHDLINDTLHLNASKVMIVVILIIILILPPHHLSFKHLTDSLGLNQHILIPSYISGNIIDLIFTPNDTFHFFLFSLLPSY